MYNQPYFIPRFMPQMMGPPLMRGMGASVAPMLGRTAATASGATRGLGLMGRLGNSISAIRSLNWGGFINNASKTLGVINQTIPLVKQVGPVMNNMKSMLRVASIFKDETDKNPRKNIKNSTPKPATSNTYTQNTSKYYPPQNNSSTNINNTPNTPASTQETTKTNTDFSPTFFINT